MSTLIGRLQYRAVQRKISLLSAVNMPWKLMYALVAMGFLAMLFFYIFGINQLTQGTYLIKNYNKEIKNLMAQNRSLQVQATGSDVMASVAQRVEVMGFEKITKAIYVQVGDGSFAKAK